jgi:hypothetical protein
MSDRVAPSLGPIRGAGVASVNLRPGSLFSTRLECRPETVELVDRKHKRANLASQTEKSKHRRRLGETKENGSGGCALFFQACPGSRWLPPSDSLAHSTIHYLKLRVRVPSDRDVFPGGILCVYLYPGSDFINQTMWRGS